MTTLKIILTSKKKLQNKYGTKFKSVEKLLLSLVSHDKKNKIQTKIIYIDDPASSKKVGVTATTSINERSCKQSVDQIFSKLKPAYLTIFGSQDIIPFQTLNNPTDDEDIDVPSDLPYACEAHYGKEISSFTGPTRAVGRIPDIPEKSDLEYLKTIINIITSYKPVDPKDLTNCFAVSAAVWSKSTKLSLDNMFGNSSSLKNSPPSKISYPAIQLKPLTHFYNCHGSPIDPVYYGQQGKSYPKAMEATDLNGKVSSGTIVAAECCYGAQLYNPDEVALSIANNYFQNGAIAFVGSSTIAYGPKDGQDLADLITQYFIINILEGASTGRALLEARQKFITTVGPALTSLELKTLAQFYLLGDSSVHPAQKPDTKSAEDSIENKRMNLFSKGMNISKASLPSKKIKTPSKKNAINASSDIKKVFKQTGFTGNEKQSVYRVPKKKTATFAKSISSHDNGSEIRFRTYTKKKENTNHLNIFDVLILKEKGKELLAWRLYQSK